MTDPGSLPSDYKVRTVTMKFVRDDEQESTYSIGQWRIDVIGIHICMVGVNLTERESSLIEILRAKEATSANENNLTDGRCTIYLSINQLFRSI